MDAALRQAWTQIVTADDYETHMAAIGQAQAAAELTGWLLDAARLREGSSVLITGAGTGQMFDYHEPERWRGYRLTCADLNPRFLERLGARLARCGLAAEIVADDLEQSRLAPGADLLLAALVLEHIDWRRGVASFARLAAGACGIVIQENPPEMASAVTPGRVLPPSIARAVETAHPILVPRGELVEEMQARGFGRLAAAEREVADGKRLAALLFGRTARR